LHHSTVAIAKGRWFCLPQYIESAAADVFKALDGEGFLRGLPRDVFTERLSYYLGEVNAIHPFREGNGRAQRAFSEQLAACQDRAMSTVTSGSAEPAGQAAANDYDSFAEAYSAANEVSLLNAYYERPATLALAGDVARPADPRRRLRLGSAVRGAA
jgi:fido (protein-threonine AMPylation protein)